MHDSSFDRSTSLGYEVNHLSRMMARALGERIGRHGVVPGQFAQLLVLYEHDGVTVTELASSVAIEHPTMSRTLRRMERDGLVETRANPTDGRSTLVYLTEHGRELEDALKADAAEVNREFLSPLSASERNQLIELLNRIITSYRP